MFDVPLPGKHAFQGAKQPMRRVFPPFTVMILMYDGQVTTLFPSRVVLQLCPCLSPCRVTNKQKFKVRQPQRAARSKRPNTTSGSHSVLRVTLSQAACNPGHLVVDAADMYFQLQHRHDYNSISKIGNRLPSQFRTGSKSWQKSHPQRWLLAAHSQKYLPCAQILLRLRNPVALVQPMIATFLALDG